MLNEKVDPSDKLNGYCPYCKKLVHFSWCHTGNEYEHHVINRYLGKYYIENKVGIWAMAECPSCDNIVLIKMKIDSSGYDNNALVLVEIIPAPLPNPTDDRVKEK